MTMPWLLTGQAAYRLPLDLFYDNGMSQFPMFPLHFSSQEHRQPLVCPFPSLWIPVGYAHPTTSAPPIPVEAYNLTVSRATVAIRSEAVH